MSNVSFGYRRIMAANMIYKAAALKRESAALRHSAFMETGRTEEIRLAHNEAIEAYADELSAAESLQHTYLDVNGILPEMRHIP